jgi:hypothetical protein
LSKSVKELWRITGSRGRTADRSVVRVDDQTRCMRKDGHDVVRTTAAESQSFDVKMENMPALSGI